MERTRGSVVILVLWMSASLAGCLGERTVEEQPTDDLLGGPDALGNVTAPSASTGSAQDPTSTGRVVPYHLVSRHGTTAAFTWQGVGGTIDGVTNPALAVAVGETLVVTIEHGCDATDTHTHDLRVLRAGEEAASSGTIEGCGDTAELRFTPKTAGAFDYFCAYHADTQRGTLDVTGDLPPVADLSADATKGQVPFTVRFTLDGSDPENGPLTWTFDPGDGNGTQTGDTLPTTLEHPYSTAGDITATLVVADGTTNSTATLRLEVIAADVQIPDPVVIKGQAAIGNPAYPASCLRNGIDGNMHAISPAASDWTYTLGPTGTFQLFWWASDQPHFLLGGLIGRGDDHGTVPDGATHAEICMKGGTGATAYTLTLWHPGDPDAP